MWPLKLYKDKIVIEKEEEQKILLFKKKPYFDLIKHYSFNRKQSLKILSKMK
jgi:hypothetical protein